MLTAPYLRHLDLRSLPPLLSRFPANMRRFRKRIPPSALLNRSNPTPPGVSSRSRVIDVHAPSVSHSVFTSSRFRLLSRFAGILDSLSVGITGAAGSFLVGDIPISLLAVANGLASRFLDDVAISHRAQSPRFVARNTDVSYPDTQRENGRGELSIFSSSLRGSSLLPGGRHLVSKGHWRPYSFSGGVIAFGNKGETATATPLPHPASKQE